MLSRIRKIVISAAALSVLLIAAPFALGQAPDFSFRAVDGPAVEGARVVGGHGRGVVGAEVVDELDALDREVLVEQVVERGQ